MSLESLRNLWYVQRRMHTEMGWSIKMESWAMQVSGRQFLKISTHSIHTEIDQ